MKSLFLLVTIILFSSVTAFASVQPIKLTPPEKKIETLEKTFDGKIGVYAINTNNNQIIAYRANERFPVQSTSKLIAVAALLKQSQRDKNLLQDKIHYTKKDLLPYSFVTEKHVATGMTLESLSEAAITYSDNAAMNFITKKLGGPKTVTNFARTIGNKTFDLDHYEDHLNSNPKNTDDTSTPKDMAISLEKLTLGNILKPSQRTQLINWMKNNTTGNKTIRAGVPRGWIVADKTGAGSYGVLNDIGILLSPACKPIVLAIYTVQNKQNAKYRYDILAKTTHIVMKTFAKNDPCYNVNT